MIRECQMTDRLTEYLSRGLLETMVDEKSKPGERVLRGLCPLEVVENKLGRKLTVAQYERIFDLYVLQFDPISKPNREHFLAFASTVQLPRARVEYSMGGFDRKPSRIRSLSVPLLNDEEDGRSWSLVR